MIEQSSIREGSPMERGLRWEGFLEKVRFKFEWKKSRSDGR